MKNIVVLGGPNGAGKTTAATQVIAHRLEIREFVNADEIARGLSPFNPEGSALAAGRIMLERMRDFVQAGHSFAFETTCSGQGHATLLRRLRGKGWHVTLIYLWLRSPQMALERVARRVQQGGHHIPDDVVIRRYWAGLSNMHNLYLPVANVAFIYDSSDNERVLVAERTTTTPLLIHDAARWAMIERTMP